MNRNHDTGLTPQEEEELLRGEEDLDLSLEDDAERLLEDIESNQDFLVPIPEQFNNSDPLRLELINEEVNAAKGLVRNRSESHQLQETSQNDMRNAGNGLGGLAPSDEEKRFWPKPERTTSIQSREGRSGIIPPVGRKTANQTRETIKTLEENRKRAREAPRSQNKGEPFEQYRQLKPKKYRPDPDPEVVELEDGEICSETGSPPREAAMGGKVSIPKMLRRCAEVIEVEEGEIEEVPPSSPETSLQRDSGMGSAEGIVSPTPVTWQKNGGRGVKSRVRKSLLQPGGTCSHQMDTAGDRGGREQERKTPNARRKLAGELEKVAPRSPVPNEPGPCKKARRGRSMVRHRLPTFNERKIVSLPDLDVLRYKDCRTYQWRKRGGSLGRGQRVTPRDFRPQIRPRRVELRPDGVVAQRERRIVQERKKRFRDGERKEVSCHSPVLVVDLTKEGTPVAGGVAARRKALEDLQRVRVRYQELLNSFATKFGGEEDDDDKPKKPRLLSEQRGVAEDVSPAGPPSDDVRGSSSYGEGTSEQRDHHQSNREDRLEIDEDEDAVQVRQPDPEEPVSPVYLPPYGREGVGDLPLRPPQGVTPSDTALDLRRAPAGSQSGPPPPALPPPPHPPARHVLPRVLPDVRPAPPHLPPPGGVALGRRLGDATRRHVEPPRTLRPRVRPPPPVVLLPQRGPGIPGTGSRATRQRRLRRERAEFFAAAARNQGGSGDSNL